MTRVLIEKADIAAPGRHRPGLVKVVHRILDERDQPGSGRVPSLAEKIKMPRRGEPLGVGDRRHLLQTDDHLGLPAVHVHLPDAGLAWGVLVLVYVLDPDILGSPVLHALEIVSQRCGTIG